MKKPSLSLARCVRTFAGSAALFFALLAPALAQPGGGGPQPGPSDPTAIPLDGGVSLLLAAGVGLGLKRLRKRRRTAPPATD